MNDCVFCKIVRGEIPSDKIYESDNFISILDANPKFEGHTIVISKKYLENLIELPSSFGEELLECVKETASILMKKYEAEGFNFMNNNSEVAQQLIPHLHFHILPRKKGDGEIKIVH